MNDRTTPRLAQAASFLAIFLVILVVAAPLAMAETPGVHQLNAPLAFEPNVGQADSNARYIARGAGYDLALAAEGARILISDKRGSSQGQPSSVVRMRFVDSNSAPEMAAADKLEGTTNYLIGSDPSKWHTDIPNFGKVHYTGIYNGIDLVYYGTNGLFEYDFVVHPQGDPQAIRFRLEGSDSVHIDNGDLIVETAAGNLALHKPIAYQESNGTRERVESAYVIDDDRQVRFTVGSYDKSRTLVIDPSISIVGIGGNPNSVDAALATGVSSTGELYIAGYLVGSSFAIPGTNPKPTMYLAKFAAGSTGNPTITYISGSQADYAFALAVESSCSGTGTTNPGSCAIIGGVTSSSDFPSAGSTLGGDDGVVLKVNPAGNGLLYATRIGGSGADRVDSLAIAPTGTVYVAGATQSTNLTTTYKNGANVTAGSWSPLAIQVAPANGTIVANTGTILPAGPLVLPCEPMHAVKIGIGNVSGSTFDVYVVGTQLIGTTYYACPNVNNGKAFVTKLDPTLATVGYTNYYGDNFQTTMGNAIAALPSSAGAYLVGTVTGTLTVTCVTPCPTSYQSANATPGNTDAFALRLDGNGNVTAYTYLGSGSNDNAADAALDTSNPPNLVVVGDAGTSTTKPFPTQNAAQVGSAGSNDGFITKFTPDLSQLVYSTLAGTPNSDYLRAVSTGTGFVYAGGYSGSPSNPHSFVSVLNESTTSISNFTIDNCVTSPCLVTAANVLVATATVVLSGPGTPQLLPTNTDVTFGTAQPAGTNTWTIPITSTAQAVTDLGPGKSVQFGVQAGVGSSVSQLINMTLTGPPALSSITVSPNPAPANSAPGAVTITVPVGTQPSGSTVTISVTSGAAFLSIVGSATQSITQSSVVFTATTGNPPSAVQVHIHATLTGPSGQSSSTDSIPDLTINPAVWLVSSVSVSPASVKGGSSATGTVNLASCGTIKPAAPQTIYLTATGPAAGAVTLPVVSIPAGSCSSAPFTIATSPVLTDGSVTIGASVLPGATQGTTATLNILAPRISAFTLNPTQVNVGGSSTGTITLDGPAAAGTTIAVSSNSTASIVSFPTSVGVNANSTTSTFTIQSASQPLSTSVTFTAALNGSNFGTTPTLTIVAPAVTSLSFNPSTVAPGNSTTATITLNGPAAANTTVSVTSNAAGTATFPSSVPVTQGNTTAQFTITAAAPQPNASVVFTAALNGSTAAQTLKIVNAGSATAFASMTVDLDLNYHKDDDTAEDSFDVKGVFSLGAGSDGINPVTEPVTLQFGTYSVTIPGGFRMDGNPNHPNYHFEGKVGEQHFVWVIQGVPQPGGDKVPTNQFAFILHGDGVNLTPGAVSGYPNIPVTLTIGNDTGTAVDPTPEIDPDIFKVELTLSANTVQAGSSVTATVSLECDNAFVLPTPVIVNLTADSPAVTVPSSVTVPAGSSCVSAPFTLTTSSGVGTKDTNVHVTASAGPESDSENLKINH